MAPGTDNADMLVPLDGTREVLGAEGEEEEHCLLSLFLFFLSFSFFLSLFWYPISIAGRGICVLGVEFEGDEIGV
jgi:hypothetical protein